MPFCIMCRILQFFGQPCEQIHERLQAARLEARKATSSAMLN
jgi:hypothetical protein